MATDNRRKSGNTVVSKKSIKKKKIRNIILMLVEVSVLAVLVVLCIYFFNFGDRKPNPNGGNGGDNGSANNNDGPVTEKVVDDDGTPSGINDEIADIMTDDTVDNAMKDYYLIALFGVDSRSESLTAGDNRSDSIMVAAIHKKTNDVKLVSVYRDTYLNVDPEEDNNVDNYNKCNAAYALGSYKRAVTMLNANLDLYIEDYVSVGFLGLINAVDALGGVYIDVDDAEILHLNNYQAVMASELNMEYDKVEDTGYQLLNGLQATAYCRIRYTTGDDYKRAERQREVLVELLNEAKKASFSELSKAASSILGNLSTSLTLDEILDILGDISSYEIVEQDGFPNQKYRTSGLIGKKSCVVPVSLTTNVKWLHEFLFDAVDYKVSNRVQLYSDTIYSIAYPYLGENVVEK